MIYLISSCDGRVVKATDLKSVGIFPHRFKSCSQRIIFLNKKVREIEKKQNK